MGVPTFGIYLFSPICLAPYRWTAGCRLHRRHRTELDIWPELLCRPLFPAMLYREIWNSPDTWRSETTCYCFLNYSASIGLRTSRRYAAADTRLNPALNKSAS